jgi:integrase/recombinase XerD
MELIKANVDRKLFYIFFDKEERVVELPTFFIRSLQHKPKYSSKSIHSYAKVLKYFCSFIEKDNFFSKYRVDEGLKALGGDSIDKYLVSLKNAGLEARTIRTRDTIIKVFMEWLTTNEAGYVRTDSGYANGKLKSANPSKRIPKDLSLREVIEFIKLLHDENQRCLAHFLFDSGLRVDEIPFLLKKDIPDLTNQPDNMYFKVLIQGGKGRGGNKKPREIILSRPIIERIDRLHNSKLYLKANIKYKDKMPCFLNVNGERLTDNSIRALLRAAALRGKLDAKKYSPHKFRHSTAASILRSEHGKNLLENLVITKMALGHNHIGTTEQYTNSIPERTLNRPRNDNDDSKRKEIIYRFEESQKIFDETFKPQKLHTEKRGRRNQRRMKK